MTPSPGSILPRDLFPRTMDSASTQTPVRPPVLLTPATVGLSAEKLLDTATSVASAVASFIVEKFSYDDELALELGTQLTFYFSKVGVVTESSLFSSSRLNLTN